MKNYKCECCGAPLHIKRGSLSGNLICAYCGNEYKVEEDNVVKIETFQKPVTTLSFKQVMPEALIRQVGEEKVVYYVKREIARQIAEELLNGDFIEFKTEFEPIIMSQVLKARLRVVNGGYTFR